MLNSFAPKTKSSRLRKRRSGLFRSVVVAIAIAAVGLAVLHPRFTRTVHAAGGVSLNTIGTAVTQNFDTLASTPVNTNVAWADDSTLTGWFAQFTAVTSNPTTYRIGTGSDTTGAIYSFGVAGTNAVTERAFGSVSSGTPGDIYFAVKLTNNTGTTITGLLISYNGEQWRDGGNVSLATQKLDFQYQVANAGTITDANTPTTGWTDYDPLDFTGPKATATAGALDGNAAANRIAKSALMPTGNVANGQEIWLRWKDINDTGNDHGLAVDDFSVTPLGGSISTNGVRTTDIQGTDDGGFAMVLQPDGKIVVGGYAVNGSGNKDFALVRYNYNGTLDTTFNTTGKVVTDFNGTSDRIWGLALQSDGKIVAVGETVKPVTLDNDVAIARYTTAGALDTTFGGTGKVTTDYLAGNNSAYAVAMSGTSIFVVGAATVSGNLDFMVSKYTSVGVLDVTFNTAGTVPGTNTVGFSGFNDVARAVVLPISGKIVLGGYARSASGDDDFAIAQFTAAGTLDTASFGGGTGKAALDLASGGTNSADQAFAMGLNPVSNAITLAGSTFNNTTGNKDFAIVRYTSAGALDLSFGSATGIVRTDFNNSPDVAQAVYVRPSDGFITAGGFSRYSLSSDDFAIARYTVTGQPDTSLNGTGKLTHPISNADERIYGIAEEFDGKIVAAGFAAVAGSNPVTRDFAIARFSSAGVLDATNATQLNQPDLLTTKTGPTEPNSVIAGQNFTYTITVENRGLAAASNVVITDVLPAALTYVSHSATNGSSNQSGGTVTNNVGTLGAGATATLTITVTASNTPQLVANTASATLTEADATPGNNTATEYTRIIGLIDMSFSPSTVTGGCQNSTGTVTLSGAAPTGGATVLLQTVDPAAANPGSQVVVPAGQTSANFTVVTGPVASNRQVRMQADLGPTTFVRRLVVNSGVCNVGP